MRNADSQLLVPLTTYPFVMSVFPIPTSDNNVGEGCFSFFALPVCWCGVAACVVTKVHSSSHSVMLDHAQEQCVHVHVGFPDLLACKTSLVIYCHARESLVALAGSSTTRLNINGWKDNDMVKIIASGNVTLHDQTQQYTRKPPWIAIEGSHVI